MCLVPSSHKVSTNVDFSSRDVTFIDLHVLYKFVERLSVEDSGCSPFSHANFYRSRCTCGLYILAILVLSENSRDVP